MKSPRESPSLPLIGLPQIDSHQAYARALQGTGTAAAGMQSALHDGQLLGVRYACAPYDLAVAGLGAARLSINLTAAQAWGGLEGDRPRSHETRVHSMFLTPPGAAARWRKAVPTAHINLYFAAGDPGEEDRPAQALMQDPPALLNIDLPGTRSLIAALDLELRRNDPFCAEAIDSLGRLLLIAVARGHHPAARDTADALPAGLLKRLADFVDAHLGRRLLVSELAGVVGMPPAAFAMRFLRRTGQTPHQFVMGRRLACACGLLAAGRHSISDVALACGFSSQSHLTRVMRDRLGQSPAQWQAHRRGADDGRT